MSIIKYNLLGHTKFLKVRLEKIDLKLEITSFAYCIARIFLRHYCYYPESCNSILNMCHRMWPTSIFPYISITEAKLIILLSMPCNHNTVGICNSGTIYTLVHSWLANFL